MKIIHNLLSIVIVILLYGTGIAYDDISQIENVSPTATVNPAICSYNNGSFHGITSGKNANWYVIKFSSSSPINISEMYIQHTYRCSDVRIEWDGYILTNLTYSEDGGTILEVLNKSECFFHIRIGSFEYTSDHLSRYTRQNFTSSKMWRHNFSLSPGIWYLICFAGETTECTQEVYLNTTNRDVRFLATSEGEGTHILLPEDFLGNLNIKWGYNLTGVLNGKKTIKVNNTLLGIHYSMFKWPCCGFERFQCIDPDGNTETFTILSLSNHKMVFSDFSHRLIMGKEGIWNFKLNLLMLPGRSPDGSIFSPGFGMGLIYADMILP